MNNFEKFLAYWEAHRPPYMEVPRPTLYKIWLAKEGEFTKCDSQIFNRIYTWYWRVKDGGDTSLDNLDD